jgi:hypothetical protein
MVKSKHKSTKRSHGRAHRPHKSSRKRSQRPSRKRVHSNKRASKHTRSKHTRNHTPKHNKLDTSPKFEPSRLYRKSKTNPLHQPVYTPDRVDYSSPKSLKSKVNRILKSDSGRIRMFR